MYINVTNPLSDKDIKQLVKLYSKSFSFDYYKLLTQNDSKEPERDDIYNTNSSLFFAYMFNLWKKSITDIDMNKFNELKDKGVLEDQFLTLQSYLMNIPDVNDKSEIYDIVHGGGDDLYFLFLRYGYQPEQSRGWNEFYSEQYTSYRNKHFSNDYSFIINPMYFDTTLFCHVFVRRCLRKNLPFYFKFNDTRGINNKLIIYSDKEHLNDYLSIIREIKNDYNRLADRCMEPNKLYGRVDGWIGFGSHKNPYHDSYLLDRTLHLDKSISEFTQDYIDRNTGKEIGDRKTTIIDYITDTICKLYISRLRNYREKLKEYKLSYRVLKSKFFYNSLFRTVKKNLIVQLEIGKIEPINFIYSRANLTINKELIDDAMRACTYNILSSDPEQFSKLREYILSTGDIYDISDNYFLYNSNNINKTEIRK